MINMNSFTSMQKNHFGNFTYIANKQSNIMSSGERQGSTDTQTENTYQTDEKGYRGVHHKHFEDINEEEDENGGDHGEMFVEIVQSH